MSAEAPWDVEAARRLAEASLICAHCGRNSQQANCELLMCSRCRNARYCNAEHQKLDWPLHKESCRNAKLIQQRIAAFDRAVVSQDGISQSQLAELMREFAACYRMHFAHAVFDAFGITNCNPEQAQKLRTNVLVIEVDFKPGANYNHETLSGKTSFLIKNADVREAAAYGAEMLDHMALMAAKSQAKGDLGIAFFSLVAGPNRTIYPCYVNEDPRWRPRENWLDILKEHVEKGRAM